MKVLVSILLTVASTEANAAEVYFRAKVKSLDGHVIPACRILQVQRSDNGQNVVLRLGSANNETGIAAVAMTALATGLDVMVDYDTANVGSCGTEPVPSYLSLRAPGF